MKVAIVVPCYNEAARFPVPAFRSFLQQHPDLVFILANDGSRDGTAAVLRELAVAFPDRVHVLDRAENRGKAETVREGMLYAMSVPGMEVAGFWDADLATPLEAIFDLLAILEQKPGVQMVFGSRVKLLGRDIQRLAVRHYLGRGFATAVSLMLDLPIYDTQCGAKLFRKQAALAELFREPFLSRWIFDVEVIARWIRHLGFDRAGAAATIYEFPLHAWRDVGGSKIKPADFVRALADLARIWRRYFSRA